MALLTRAFETLYGGAAGGGKALALDTPILTTAGWKTMGEVEVGDRVFSETGTPCSVLAVSPVMYGRRVLEVRFDDGAAIRADADHLWITMTAGERESAMRRTEAFRARRRETRPERGTGKRPDLARRNHEQSKVLLDPPSGSARTTEEIRRTLTVGKRTNHSVANCAPLQYAPADLPIHPYILGAWLGDGSSRGQGFSCADAEIISEIESRGYRVNKWSGKYEWGIRGIKPLLRELGVLENKHIPERYLRASESQRRDLLAGLMDTDGTCLPSGACEFYSTNARLAADARDLLAGLGIKCQVREGTARLNGVDCGKKYRIKFTTAQPVFLLSRKRSRQVVKERGTQNARYIKSVVEVPSEPVRCIQVDSPSRLYLAGRELIPTHNSDLLLGMARFQHRRAVIFRRTYKDLEQSVIPRSKEFYNRGSTEGFNGSKYVWHLDNRIIWFSHLERDDSVFGHQSAAYDFIGFDELPQFSQMQYEYLFSRARSTKKGQRVRVLACANPDPGGWVFRRWAAWLDPAHPRPAKAGELRYYKRGEDGKTEVETTADDPDGVSRTFIPAKLTDNPFLAGDDQYRRNLNAMPEPFRSQLLFGDWLAGAQDADYQVIPQAHVRDAILRWRDWEQAGFPGMLTAVGNDVGGGGAQRDKSTLAQIFDQTKVRSVAVAQIADPDQATMEVCGQLGLILGRQAQAAAYIDTVGIGAGVFHRARELGMRAHAFKAGAGTELRDKTGIYGFANWRACAWWLLREMLEPGSGFDVCLPPDQELFNDLVAPRYTVTSGGLIQIESKDLIRRRRGKSTDYGDAVIQGIVGPLLVEEEWANRERLAVHEP